MLKVFRIVRVLAIAALIGVMAARASAQSPLAIDFEDAFTPDYAKRDVPTFKRVLALDGDQASIIESLIHDYNEQFEGALRMVREDLRQAQAALGVEDPETDLQREQIREEIATLFEEMQTELKNLPPSGSPIELKMKYEGHMKALQARLNQLQPQPIKPEEVEGLLDQASVRLERWREERGRIREAFIANAQAVLPEAQRGRWPALERVLYRQRCLGKSRLQGEGVDLTLIVNELRLDDARAAAIAPRLEEYELALDAALHERQSRVDAASRATFKAVQKADRAALTSIMERITQARTAVRNVNDDAASALAVLLEGDGARLMQAYRQRGYPQVFRDTQTMRLIKAAQEAPELSESQKQGLARMRAEYQAEVAAMDDQVLATVRQHEPAQVTIREVLSILPPTAEDEATERDRPVDPVQKAFEQRNLVGARYDQQLLALLGEELYERLPRNNRLNVPSATADHDSDNVR